MGFIILIFVIFLGFIIGNWYLNEQAPEEQVEAILIKKKHSSTMDANNVIHNNYYLIFDVSGITKKFKVIHKIYKEYNEFEQGILTFKRKRFVNFILK